MYKGYSGDNYLNKLFYIEIVLEKYLVWQHVMKRILSFFFGLDL